ncbi:conserved hypothetical protein [Candidatus Sulfopaludibacter sp. SbA6]|nr:conserved hypothetical protein [Candidatus Sulfopaludibacter sp. SbA6]
MGQELECTMRHQRRTLAGKAQLETDYLLFRAPPAERLKVLFKDLTGVKAAGGVLKLEFAGGPAEFELGRAAEKWAAKILDRPSRLDKLGVKPGLKVRLVGEFEEDFRRELSGRNAGSPEARAKADVVFFAAEAAGDLKRLGKIAAGIEAHGAVWVVYPKGVAAIREIEVLRAGREAGLKDIKVARFSATHTALKFVVPVAAR